MNIKEIVPDELVSAHYSRLEMNESLNNVSLRNLKQFLSSVPFFMGLFLGFAFSKSISTDLAQVFVALIGILSGFVVTLMLFTGRIDGTENLDYEAACNYKKKIVYLLWSQTITLSVYIYTALFSILWIFLQSPYITQVNQGFIAAIMIGGLFMSVFRTLLLPYQIFELHSFNLQSLLDSKERENQQKLSDFNKAMSDE